MNADTACGTLDLDARARVLVQRLAVALEGGMHRRHLVDVAGEAVAGGLQRGAVDGDVVHRPDHVAFAVARGRRHAQAKRRQVALVGI